MTKVAQTPDTHRCGQDNLELSIADGSLTVRVDTRRTLEHGGTASGNDKIASTGGNRSLGDGLKVGVNCYRMVRDKTVGGK